MGLSDLAKKAKDLAQGQFGKAKELADEHQVVDKAKGAATGVKGAVSGDGTLSDKAKGAVGAVKEAVKEPTDAAGSAVDAAEDAAEGATSV